MTNVQPVLSRIRISQAVEASIHIGLTILLAVSCLWILLPFIPLIAWGIIIAVAVYPLFRKLESALGDRSILAAVICTACFLAILVLPLLLVGGSLVGGVQTVAARIKDGTAMIPPPPPKVQTWPVIGVPLDKLWSLAARDLSQAIRELAPQIKSALPQLISASAGLGLTILQFVLSVLVSGVLLGNAKAAYELTRSLAVKLFGERGAEFQELIGSTIRSVTFGILGVAIIQSVLAALGFFVVGLPGAGVWSVVFLFAAVLQIGVVVLVPAVLYVVAVASTTKAVAFVVWCLFVGVLDNVLKPLLLGRRAAVPVMVVFLGAIGGFLIMGIIGLFVGAVVLSVGYKLLFAWLRDEPAAQAAAQ